MIVHFAGKILTIAVTVAVLAACGGGAGPQTVAPSLTQPDSSRLAQNVSTGTDIPESANPQETDAAQYCARTGGVVEVRRAVYGTNGPNTLQLAGIARFCRYTSAKDQSRIYLLLSTLYTKLPTLAALAYILKPKLSGGCQGNPASCYCTQLGGSDQFGGTTPAGGGWYKKNSVDQVLEACIFPDLSSIDSWGLTYHSAGIIRGTNLVKVLRYKYAP